MDSLTITEKIAGVIALCCAGILTAAKGVFVTKKDCVKATALCNSAIARQLEDIKSELKDGHERFKNAERYIVALAAKSGIKEEDIPKL